MKIRSFKPISNKDSKVLIIGTMPGYESLRKQEYYAHPSNHFWDILFRVLKDDYDFLRLTQENESYNEKQKLLLSNRIALWDTLKYCDRKGNLDKDIRDEISNDFEGFLKDHNGISTVLFNGKKAYDYFYESSKHLIEKNNLKLDILNSTSSTNPNNVFGILVEWNYSIKKALNVID